MVDIGLVVGDVGAGVGLGHADRQEALAAAHRRQDALLDRLGRVGRDDAGLRARPRRAPPSRSRSRPWRSPRAPARCRTPAGRARHIPPAPPCRARPVRPAPSCSPTETCRPVARRALAELALRQFADRVRQTGAARRSGLGTRGVSWRSSGLVGWAERSEAHQVRRRHDGLRCAQPILRYGRGLWSCPLPVEQAPIHAAALRPGGSGRARFIARSHCGGDVAAGRGTGRRPGGRARRPGRARRTPPAPACRRPSATSTCRGRAAAPPQR